MDILIVEDARDQRFILSTFIRKLGYVAHEAEDGRQALSYIEANPQIPIVISDWVMPEMDGIELCQTIRGRDLGRYIYFVLLTGNQDNDAVVQGMSIGADDFLHKPINFRELEVRLKAGVRIIELERTLEERNKELAGAFKIIKQDLESAAKTQAELLVQPTTIDKVSFDWFFKPSKIIGGDMFGYFSLSDEHVAFYQLDVAGHGIPSALFSFSMNNLMGDNTGKTSLLRETIAEAPYYRILDPHEVLGCLNERFQTTVESMLYFTMVYGVIHTPTGKLSISHAGHPPAMWMKSDLGETDFVEGEGVPVGMVPGITYETKNLQLTKGDRLFLYSDGIVECENNQGDMFGQDKLKNLLKESQTLPMNDVIVSVQNQIEDWQGHGQFEDDVTYLIMEWQP
ncbi:MAG: SpoIIE family protein phosphatase [Endozoicomonadaceae bacterium]|nr:SpoIIE family protein phosphatase [Endozoicomonadaceae bacterium]